MSISSAITKGVTTYEAWRAFKGVTLLTPTDGTGAALIDLQGRVVHYWETDLEPAAGAELLQNGNLLYAGKLQEGPESSLEGASGVILELDWSGKAAWEYRDRSLHHGFHRMENGNTLVLKRVKVPGTLAELVAGGIEGPEDDNGEMYGDVIQEIDPAGKVQWEWIAHKHLDPAVDTVCPICSRNTWVHINAAVALSDGSILANFMKTNTLAIIDKQSKEITWRWGQNELAHQHSPTELDNGNILVFDNGFHMRGFNFGYSRVVEVDRRSGQMVWVYTGGGGGMLHFLYSAAMSNAQRLPNGNTLICESTTGRLLEVTDKGHLVWEFLNDLPVRYTLPQQARSSMVYAAYRYGVDYPGLPGHPSAFLSKQKAPGTGELSRAAASPDETDLQGETIRSRLEALGY